MAVNIELVADKVFNLLAGSGYDILSLNAEGETVIDHTEASRFVIKEPNILVRLDQGSETVSMGVREDFDNHELRQSLKRLAVDYLMNFDFKIFGKVLKPKSETIDIAQKRTKDMGDVLEALDTLRTLSGLPTLKEFQATMPGRYSYLYPEAYQLVKNLYRSNITHFTTLYYDNDLLTNYLIDYAYLSFDDATDAAMAIRADVKEFGADLFENTKDEQLPPCELCNGKGCDACGGTGEEDGYIHRDLGEQGPDYDASDIHRGDAITCKPCKGKGCEHCDYKGVHPKEVDEASSLDSYYQLTKAKRLAKADGHDYDKLPEYHRGKDQPHKEKYKALAAEGVDEAGIVSKIKDKLGFGKKKAVNKPKLKRNPRIKVAKGAGQVSRASDGNVYVWAGAAWVNNETAKFAPKQVTAELGNPVLIGLANQIKKAGLTDVVKPFLLSV